MQVLLGAVDNERTTAGAQVSGMEAAVKDISARLSGSQLSIPAEELGRANHAAVKIQKIFRGNAARKE